MSERMKVANEAEMIVNGYAFIRNGTHIRVHSLNQLEKVSIINELDEIIETTMDDIELAIVKDYFLKNRKYMEV